MKKCCDYGKGDGDFEESGRQSPSSINDGTGLQSPPSPMSMMDVITVGATVDLNGGQNKSSGSLLSSSPVPPPQERLLKSGNTATIIQSVFNSFDQFGADKGKGCF